MRFPGFEGEWKSKKLGEIATFSKGKGISKSDIEENGLTECIRYGELYTYYGEVINDIKSKTNVDTSNLVLSEVNDVIIPASGETTIDIATASCVLKSGIALGGDLNIIKTENNGVFLSYYLNNKKKMEIANLAQGISVVHLYSSQLATLTLNFPKLEEQNRISTFLALFDARIQTQNKIIEQLETLIKGLREKLFSQETRFREFKDEWKLKRLREIGETFNGLSGKTKDNFGIGKPYIQYKQIFDSSKIQIGNCGLVEILETENQNNVQYGDVFFTISSETPNEIGMSSVLLDEVSEMYLNSFCFGYRPLSSQILNPLFSSYLFRSSTFRNEIVKLAQGSTRYNMSKIELMKLTILLPCLEEQIFIAKLLYSIELKIETEKKILEEYRSQKQYLLQNLFI
ncbi:Type I restriction-modification system, specificity subunit S [Elizabethkingia anophelis NUHP1]|uniref:Type I restriction-modification system, specificity subunit S n=2 Tax=Elizabethkingia anophelis TaxID=1117645 RepID=A0A455ZIL8_9FLAO|nr:restriction endonuclease subunit S [Elizabethkingia anophelis]AIL45395.1 Type I restriction-modification system, specificity subunit S [Elizabethkingia anophelis NUHP1]DAC76616.1 TPA_exp: Type I restriction-modification system, specificity subunit S [Elizabethkingia anophelis]